MFPYLGLGQKLQKKVIKNLGCAKFKKKNVLDEEKIYLFALDIKTIIHFSWSEQFLIDNLKKMLISVEPLWQRPS